jgi:amino acid transporter
MTGDGQQRIGLLRATMVGIGAIMGGGVLVLAGVAYAEAGPGVLAAFAANGVVALLTALSMAEISSAFPESGGTYLFAKKVLSVRLAFAVGWVLWFAYIVSGVLYAVGFASFAALGLEELVRAAGGALPGWLGGRRLQLLLAVLAVLSYAGTLARRSTAGGAGTTIGKLVVFLAIIAGGLVALMQQPQERTLAALSPFLPGGVTGVVAVMGLTFITVQGFEVVAAMAGEVEAPARTIPRAMALALGISMVIYLPLLFVVAAVGTAPGQSITALAAAQPETMVAVAARRFLGVPGYWLVVVAAVLASLSALQSTMLAAARVAQFMALDHTLPRVLGVRHARHGTPVMAIYASTLTLVAILFMVPDLAAAGAAAGLIFLVSFTLGHVTAYLARVRGGGAPDAYRTPLFPLVPVLGGAACAFLAVFQAVFAPVAAGIASIWLALGGLLYVALLAPRAQLADASAQALDPGLVRLRGKRPLVLLPVANPRHASALVAVANALVPSEIGRVLLLSVVPSPQPGGPPEAGDDGRGAAGDPAGDIAVRLADAQEVVRNALTASYATGQTPEALITAAPEPWAEIRRVARAYDCECLLLGLPRLAQHPDVSRVEQLINEVDCDVAILCAPPDWQLAQARRILVPIGGRGEQHELRARLLGSIVRTAPREVTFLRVLPPSGDMAGADEPADHGAGSAGPGDVARPGDVVSLGSVPGAGLAEARVQALRLARAHLPGAHDIDVVQAADVAAAVARAASACDLLVLGLRSEPTAFHMGRPRAVFGELAMDIARRAPCATILLSGRRSSFIGI